MIDCACEQVWNWVRMAFRRYLNVRFANLHLNFDEFDRHGGAKSRAFRSREAKQDYGHVRARLSIDSERAALLRVVARTYPVKASNGSSAQRVRLG